LTNYVEHLQPELIVNYCKFVVVSVDSPMLSIEVARSPAITRFKEGYAQNHSI